MIYLNVRLDETNTIVSGTKKLKLSVDPDSGEKPFSESAKTFLDGLQRAVARFFTTNVAVFDIFPKSTSRVLATTARSTQLGAAPHVFNDPQNRIF